MPTITKTIGTEVGRDYSTITAWEADLDNTGVYTSGDIAVGECYSDSEFVESPNINGGTGIPLQLIQLTAPSGQRHNGIAGVGARLRGGITAGQAAQFKIIEWLDIRSGDNGNSRGINVSMGTTANRLAVRNLMVHDIRTSTDNALAGIFIGTVGCEIVNSVVYNIASSRGGSDDIAGVTGPTGGRQGLIYNITVYRVERNGAGGASAIGVEGTSTDNDTRMRNVISVAVSGTATGIHSCFTFAAGYQSSNTISMDATATGTGSFTGVLPENLFISTVSGSENFRLLGSSVAINTGINIGSFPTGVNIDIRGRDRVANGDIWDIGAYEFVVDKKFLTLLGVG